MAITKTTEIGKIEVVTEYKHLQVRMDTVYKEDGKEISRTFHRHVLVPFDSRVKDNKWTHTATDLSGEDATVKAIAEAAWTDTVKAKYKTFTESQTTP